MLKELLNQGVVMKFEQINILPDDKFRRLTGIKRSTFEQMVKILSVADKKKKARGGRRNKLIIEEQLLVTLEYLREYRTYFHIGQSYGLSESSTYKCIKWVENTLIKDTDLSLPGKKSLLESDVNYEVVLIDATETPIERPKKNKKITTQAKRSSIL